MQLSLPKNKKAAVRTGAVIFAAVIFCLAVLYISFSDSRLLLGNLEGFVACSETITPGTSFKARFSVRKHSDNTPVAGAAVKASVYSESGGQIGAVQQNTDADGVAFFSIPIPENLKDSKVSVRLYTKTAEGKSSFRREFPVEREQQIRLLCDNREYFSGEQIAAQVFLTRKSDGSPVADKPVRLFLKNASDVLIQSFSGITGNFGDYQVRIPLGKLIKPGIYTLEAVSDELHTKKNLQISSVSSSSFHLSLKADPAFFIPGQSTSVTVFAEDAMGVGVADAEISAVCTEEIDSVEAGEKIFRGKTDTNGKFTFICRQDGIEKDFLSRRNTNVRVSVSAKNKNGGTVNIVRSYPLSDSLINISCFPEGKGLVSGIANRLFIATWYPDGRPVKARLQVTLKDGVKELHTGADGLAVLDFDPAEQAGFVPMIAAENEAGLKTEQPFDPSEMVSGALFNFSLDHVLYQAGDRIPIKAEGADGTVFFDLVYSSRIVNSVKTEIRAGRGEASLEIPFDIWGLCFINASSMDSEGKLEQFSQPVYIERKSDSDLFVNADKPAYYPGQKAVISSRIVDASLKGREGVVSLSVSRQDSIVSFTPAEISKPGQIPYPVINNLVQNIVYEPASEDMDMQQKMRLLLNGSVDGSPELYFENVYRGAAADAQQRRVRIFKEGFAWLFTASAALALISFFGLMLLTVRQSYLKSTHRIRLIEVGNSDDAYSLIVIVAGSLLMVAIPLGLTLFLMGMEQKNLSQILTSKSLLALAVTALLAGFIYVLNLRYIMHTGFFKGVPENFRKTAFLLYCYCVAVVSVSALILIAYHDIMSIWNFRTLLSGNMVVAELALFTFLFLPFLVFYNVSGHLIQTSASTSKILFLFLVLTSAAFIVFLAGGVKDEKSYLNAAVISVLPWNPFEHKAASEAAPPASDNRENIADFLQLRPQKSLASAFLHTDGRGIADFDFKAPSASGTIIVSAEAMTKKGQTPMAFAGFLVERPCSVYLSVPSRMHEGDLFKIPLYIKNNTKKKLKIFVEPSRKSELFTLEDLQPFYEVAGEASHIGHMTFKARGSGVDTLDMTVRSGDFSERISLNMEIVPQGRPHYKSMSGSLGHRSYQIFSLKEPESAFLKGHVDLYPGILSVMLDCHRTLFSGTGQRSLFYIYGMRTDSLIMEEMRKSNRQDIPEYKDMELHLRLSYQNLLSFEKENGGFGLFQHSPAQVQITAEALLALAGASGTVSIDEKIIGRSADYLFAQQQKNGSWQDNVRITAKAAYALAGAGYDRDERLKKARSYLHDAVRDVKDAQTLALCALALLPDRKIQDSLVGALIRNTASDGSWKSSEGLFGALPGIDGDIETTALCLKTLRKFGPDSGVDYRKSLDFIISHMDPAGSWYSPMATYAALEALSLCAPAQTVSAAQKVEFNDRVFYDGPLDPLSPSKVTVPVTNLSAQGRNELKIGESSVAGGMYRLSVSGYISGPAAAETYKGLSVKSSFNSVNCRSGDVITQYVTVRNDGEIEMGNLVLELPLPHGFSLVENSLDPKGISGYTVGAGSAVFYLKPLGKGAALNKSFSFRVSQEGDFFLNPVFLYQYTDPWNRAVAPVPRMKVRPARN